MEGRKIVEILTELGAENITPAAALRDDLGLDSLQMVNLLITIEEVFQIELEETDTLSSWVTNAFYLQLLPYS